EKKGGSGDTPDPGRRLRLLHLRCMPLAAVSEEKKGLAGAPSHCPPDSVPQTPAGGLRPPALPALDLTQRFSTTNVATAEPVPAVTFNRASAERRERQPST